MLFGHPLYDAWTQRPIFLDRRLIFCYLVGPWNTIYNPEVMLTLIYVNHDKERKEEIMRYIIIFRILKDRRNNRVLHEHCKTAPNHCSLTLRIDNCGWSVIYTLDHNSETV